MAFNSEGRIAELGKLLKGKIRADWSLLEEAYRGPFEELMWLLRHRDSVGCMMHQVAKRPAPRERNREGTTGMQVVQ